MPLYDWYDVDLGLSDQFKQACAAVILQIAFILVYANAFIHNPNPFIQNQLHNIRCNNESVTILPVKSVLVIVFYVQKSDFHRYLEWFSKLKAKLLWMNIYVDKFI